jgi:hypothetical protein
MIPKSNLSRWPLLLAIVCLLWILAIGVFHFTAPQQIISLQSSMIQHEVGCGYIAHIKQRPLAWPFTRFETDSLSFPEKSELILREDGAPFGYPHALHDTIRNKGDGNYSHWGNSLFFATPDCSDPRTNNKQYEVSIPVDLSILAVISWFLAVYFLGIRIVEFLPIQAKKIQLMLSESTINYYFLASLLIVVVAVLIKIPSLVISAEFYAETATIFFKQATESGFWEILTYTWADYLVTFQLLVSFILVRVFGVIEYFPGTVNFIFLLFVAFSVSLINLRAFRVLIPSDLLRFIVGLSLGLTPNYELYELLNSNLFGITVFLLFIFVDKEQFNRWLFYGLILLLFLTGISRPNLVAFLPVYIVLLGMALKTHRIRDIVFYGAGTVSLCLQAYVMIMAQLYWSVHADMNIYNEITGLESLYLPLLGAIYYYLRSLITVVFVQQIDGLWLILTLIFITISIILLACFYLYRKKRFLILYYFGISQILAFGLIFFITFSSPVSVNWNQFYYTPMRWWTYSNYVIYLSLMVLAFNTMNELLSRASIIHTKNTAYGLSVMAFSLIAFQFQIYPFLNNIDPFGGHDSLSNWSRYRHLLQNDDYYIPANPATSFQWGIGKDNRALLDVEVRVDGLVNGIQISSTEGDLLLRSIIVVNHYLHNSMNDLVVKAYDQDGREISVLQRLNDFEDKYLYYYFDERVRPYSLLFYDENQEAVSIQPDIHLFGKLDTTERIIITAL